MNLQNVDLFNVYKSSCNMCTNLQVFGFDLLWNISLEFPRIMSVLWKIVENNSISSCNKENHMTHSHKNKNEFLN